MKSPNVDQIHSVDKNKWPPLTVAVTGMLGSGKSTATGLLAEKGLPVIDCDQLARRVTGPGSPGLAMVREVFGPEVLKSDGTMDRRRMLSLILQDPEAHRKLENIVHPLALKELDSELKRLATDGYDTAVAEVPLLFEAGWQNFFDLSCMVTAPESVCIARIMARNQVDADTARRWLYLQMDPELKEQSADWIIRNNSTLDNLKLQVQGLYGKIMEMERRKGKSRQFPLYNR